MGQLREQGAEEAVRDNWFSTTHWSQVFLAGQPDSTKAREALATLCQRYWYPLYVFVRRQGQGPEDAQDLVQGFFERLLEKQYLKDADPEKGKFRSFLLMALRRFMVNEWDRANRLKRGGGRKLISLDEQDTEDRYKAEPVDEMSPERAYQRQWAMIVLEQVLDRLEAEFVSAGKAELFSELRVYLGGEPGAGSYAEIGGKLGMTPGALKVTVHRLRQRFRELLRLEIANTVAKAEEIDNEIRELFAALS
jgi:RNA polymerase sigma-70 factor (ECF subfamily)